MSTNTKRQYTAKHTRKKGTFNFIRTPRDEQIIFDVNKYRYMKTEQVKRLHFPEAKTPKNTQRRLKYLFHEGYLGRIFAEDPKHRHLKNAYGASSTAYYVDKKGADFLKENYEDIKVFYSRKRGLVAEKTLNHALDVSEFCINLDLALKDHPIFTYRDTVLDFEMREGMEKATGHAKYKLYTNVEHPLTKKSYVFYPDIQFVLQGKENYKNLQALYFVEIDRGTESLLVIQEKILGYSAFLKNNFHNFLDIGNFKSFKVLIQTSSLRRAKHIRKALEGTEGNELVLVTHYNVVNEKSLFNDEIWINARDKEVSIFSKKVS